MGIKNNISGMSRMYFLLFPSLDLNNQKISSTIIIIFRIISFVRYRQLHPLCSVKISGCCVPSNQIKGDQDVRRSCGNLPVPSEGLNSGPSEPSGRLIILCT